MAQFGPVSGSISGSTFGPGAISALDVVVIGSGAAGLYAALMLPEHLRIGIVTKDRLQTGSSSWAQGGIAAAIDPKDSPQFHLEDTLSAGAGLCDRGAGNLLVNEAAMAIESLLALGVAFDRKDGILAKTLEAAHSHPRVLHSADTTGRAIVDILVAQVQKRTNIQIFTETLAIALWQHPTTRRCQGVALLDQGRVQWVRAAAVVLATGGGGQIYAQTTNPAVSTGDGVAIAHRSGAILRDLEFFQFHPTALTVPGAPRFLISEAVRGEGAHLVDHTGDRFAFSYHPDGELAPRDVVSRAIFSHLQNTAADPANAHVYLDLSPIAPDKIRYRFPKIIQVCQRWGIDVFQQRIPVAPAAHYWMGGIAVDLSSQTSIPGLYAIGETASTGVHGANRLASNSLLECLVFARQLAKMQLSDSPVAKAKEQSALLHQPKPCWSEEVQRFKAIRQAVPKHVWQTAGVYRSRSTLKQGLADLQAWQSEVAQFDLTRCLRQLNPGQPVQFDPAIAPSELITAVETLNLLEVSALMLKSAAFREESRGGHFRVDIPKPDPQWHCHTLIEGDRITTAKVQS